MNPTTFSHPRILPFLCLTEMWERFGFYVAQGLLVLYMTQQFHLSDNSTYSISGIFSALVYISPFLGGFLADRFLGFKTAITWGGLLLILGYATLASANTVLVFYFGLAIIIVGNGLFKPNISSLLGTQYTALNPKRDSGFTIFYVGINIGVALSGLSGYVKEFYGWKVTYSLASIGMAIGLATFLYSLRYLETEQKPLETTGLQKVEIFIGCAATIIVVNFLLHLRALTDILLPASGVFLLLLLALLVLRQRKEDRKSLLMLNFLILSSIVFWMLFLQLFNSANLYVSRLVAQNLFGIPLTPTIFWASESIYIFALGPIMAWLWQHLGELNPAPMQKFLLGILFTSASFAVLACSTYFPDSSGYVHPFWVFGSYFLLTIGELLISPVGLSAVTSLAPSRLIGMMMGVWFVATGFGGYFAGWLARLANVPVETIATTEKLDIYKHAFFIYAAIALAVAIILFAIRLAVKSGLNNEKHRSSR